MSPCRLNNIDELNYLIRLHDLAYFKAFITSNRVSYRVSMFKAIESGSSELTDIVRWHHPHPEDEDTEFEGQHAAFRGFLNIYQTIQLHEEMEEFNAYRENMYLFHGRLDQVNMAEIDMHDLLSPNPVPVAVCDKIVARYGYNSCLMTGCLLAYCIHNSDNYTLLKASPHIFIMDMMFQYAHRHGNEKLKRFLVSTYRATRQHSNYDYRLRKDPFYKRRQYNGALDMYDHHLVPTTATDTIGAKKDYTNQIYINNVCLSTDLFEWQTPKMADCQVDTYFEQVLDYVNRLIDQGIELQEP
ncbi:hypothetical protein PS15p_209653 [Mucor circinelloides]